MFILAPKSKLFFGILLLALIVAMFASGHVVFVCALLLPGYLLVSPSASGWTVLRRIAAKGLSAFLPSIAPRAPPVPIA